MILHYDIPDLVPYINWSYFYFAWQLKDEKEQQSVRQEAEAFLQQVSGRYQAHALFRLMEAYSDGDDIVVRLDDESAAEVSGSSNNDGEQEGRLPCLRQQQSASQFLCLADFIAARDAERSPLTSQIGLFATSVDSGMESDFNSDPYQKMMAQLLADRLAEAAAECLHERVRKELWGYAPDEQLTMDDLHLERFQGIRPAVGYPSLPDASFNFVLDRLLHFREIGIRLTESGAMRPHASVSGLMMAHPDARYFAVGKIGEDQLQDYARRRSMPVSMARKFLSANL